MTDVTSTIALWTLASVRRHAPSDLCTFGRGARHGLCDPRSFSLARLPGVLADRGFATIASRLRITTLRRDLAADLLQEQHREIFDSSPGCTQETSCHAAVLSVGMPPAIEDSCGEGAVSSLIISCKNSRNSEGPFEKGRSRRYPVDPGRAVWEGEPTCFSPAETRGTVVAERPRDREMWHSECHIADPEGRVSSTPCRR